MGAHVETGIARIIFMIVKRAAVYRKHAPEARKPELISVIRDCRASPHAGMLPDGRYFSRNSR